MQILCKTTPIQLARHYAMDIRDIPWRPRAMGRSKARRKACATAAWLSWTYSWRPRAMGLSKARHTQ